MALGRLQGDISSSGVITVPKYLRKYFGKELLLRMNQVLGQDGRQLQLAGETPNTRSCSVHDLLFVCSGGRGRLAYPAESLLFPRCMDWSPHLYAKQTHNDGQVDTPQIYQQGR